MMKHSASVSPRVLARCTGAFYLLTVLTGIFAQGFVAERLIAWGDAATTATNILAHRSLFQAGYAVYLVEMACQVVTVALFYELLKPAGRIVSLVAAFIGLTGCVIKAMARVFFIAPLFVLGGGSYLSVFTADQLKALALVLLEVNDHAAALSLVFFGFYAVLTGYVMIRSTFLPRLLGALGIVGGAGWLAFLNPPLGYRLFMDIAPLGLLGAVAIIFWLLVFGVNEERWRRRANGVPAGV